MDADFVDYWLICHGQVRHVHHTITVSKQEEVQIMGRRRCCGNNNNNSDNDMIMNPTETVMNVNTNTRTVRNVYPTEVINVNRTVIRNENYYPVTEREMNETVVENINCGSNPGMGCQPNGNGNSNGNNGNNNGNHGHCCRKKGRLF